MKTRILAGAILAAISAQSGPGASAGSEPQPWMKAGLSADERATLVEGAMTEAEKFTLLHGHFAIDRTKPDGSGHVRPKDAIGSAGYVPGIPRLGIPALQESDASLGVANPGNIRKGDGATALPSGLATAAGFDVHGAYEGGAMIGREAWLKGFNLLLAGGVNLARDPRNGRNFEYLGEDPLLAGRLGGEAIRGIQDQHVVSTIKHFALNDQETGRMAANGVIDAAALRESDLLAFEIASESGHPGSVMCGYNLVNGAHDCRNPYLLDTVLKGDWHYPGWVMSDWSAVRSANDASAGLDQESGQELDREVYFDKPLQEAVATGAVSAARIDDMVHRILRSMFEVGLFDSPPKISQIDYDADGEVAEKIAEHGIVLLKNGNGILPLSLDKKRIAVIGGHAEAGVLSGGGSSQVVPVSAAGTYPVATVGGEETLSNFTTMIYDPSSPVAAMRGLSKDSVIRFDTGRYLSSAVALAKSSDIAVIFATQWMTEGEDAPDLGLPDGQDALIEAVAAANPHTIVVLETGNPIVMPWLGKVEAVVEAWYPGQRGGEAIANVLFGKTVPSGHLPITFPQSVEQNPRAVIPCKEAGRDDVCAVDYSEGADVGYRWFAKRGLRPMFPFGYGLSYTSFDFKNLKVEGGETLKIAFDVRNSGTRAGDAVPQVYLTGEAGKTVQRLIGFERLSLSPGESRHVELTADPRILGDFDETARKWRVGAGSYTVSLSRSATDSVMSASATLQERVLAP